MFFGVQADTGFFTSVRYCLRSSLMDACIQQDNVTSANLATSTMAVAPQTGLWKVRIPRIKAHLPLPESPTSATSWPGFISRVTPWRASCLGRDAYAYFTPRRWTCTQNWSSAKEGGGGCSVAEESKLGRFELSSHLGVHVIRCDIATAGGGGLGGGEFGGGVPYS